ncbi:peptidoglycan bridge formation glycyltransferase FemA/FemB family protein [Maribacter cobaltidurans]|nr:peptidoglycan bridge formation glycyltransferase FemA/FemB family protein [Maribacter cobaltidurans]
MIEILKDKEDWVGALNTIEHTDFYFSYDYHHFSKNQEEEPILIKYSTEEGVLLLPLLLRNIEGTAYKDAISVYGYAGVLTNISAKDFDRESFQKTLHNFFEDNQIVSVFSRLHPFMEYQDELLQGLGSISDQGMVVYLDLSLPIDVQRAGFNRRLKTYLNKARKVCTVSMGTTEEELDAFIHLYHENMKRVDATESYFFDKPYFDALMASKDYTPCLMVCRDNESQQIIAGAIFVKKDNMVQYHLSGLHEDFFELNPIKLIIDEMRLIASEEGYEFMNLGGGRGGSNEDSLFRFKSGFSKAFKDFKLWKYIVNDKVYNDLCQKHLDGHSEVDIKEVTFFPAYRAPYSSIFNMT